MGRSSRYFLGTRWDNGERDLQDYESAKKALYNVLDGSEQTEVTKYWVEPANGICQRQVTQEDPEITE